MDMLESLGLELAIHRDLDVLARSLFYDIIQSVKNDLKSGITTSRWVSGQNHFEISVDCDRLCRFLHKQKALDPLYKQPWNPHRINLPSPPPRWRLFSLSVIHIFATGSTARAYLFYGTGIIAAYLNPILSRFRTDISIIFLQRMK